MYRTRLRKRFFGQFYTPPSIVKLVVRLAIRGRDDSVLDPAAGDGVFVEGAYERLLELGASPLGASKKIVAVEVDPEAYSKVKDRLSGVKILNTDFFEASLSKFDVIVGNPPYIEQREIGRKSAIRNVALANEKRVKMNARAGMYAYFITHGEKLLKEDGFLCFVVSSSWLDSIWGTDLQNFILDKFMIISIIAFGRDIFSEAMVETVIILLQKCSSESKRDKNKAKLVLVKKELEIDRIAEHVESSDSYESDSLRTIVKRQADLRKTRHWGEIFRESFVVTRLLQNSLLVPLQNLADVQYCFKEGAYDFFILSQEDISKWDIEERYLKPVISSPTPIETYNIIPEDIKERILLVDEPKSALRNTRVLSYIEEGESREIEGKRGMTRGKKIVGFNNLPTFYSKKLWYSLRKSSTCPILMPAFVRNRFFAIRNDAQAYATANFYGVIPFNKNHILPILAFFNSSLAALMIELKGRTSMGRGLLDIRSYTLRSLPVPDFNRIDEIHNARLGELFSRMCKGAREGRKSEAEKTKVKLDDAFFDVLGITNEREIIINSLEELRAARNRRSAAGVLVVA